MQEPHTTTREVTVWHGLFYIARAAQLIQEASSPGKAKRPHPFQSSAALATRRPVFWRGCSLAPSYRWAFESLGATASIYCLARAFRSTVPRIGGRLWRRLLEGRALRAFNMRLTEDLSGQSADLILVLKGNQLDAATVRTLRASCGAPIVNFYPDDPFSNVHANRMRFGSAVLAEYDACFTFARHLMPAYRTAGVREVIYLPFARDPQLHAPVAPTAEPEFDVIFVGNLDESRVRWLEGIADFRIGIFGERVERSLSRRSPLRRATLGPAAYAAALSAMLSRSAVSLNLMRDQNRLSHNMRSFESPGSGAFTLSQRTPELVQLFQEGREILCFSTPDELRAHVAWSLAHPEERARIAQAGFDRVRDDTYATRAEQILDSVGITARQVS